MLALTSNHVQHTSSRAVATFHLSTTPPVSNTIPHLTHSHIYLAIGAAAVLPLNSSGRFSSFPTVAGHSGI